MSSFKRRQQKQVKKPYRVRNWAEYEAGLRNRGSLTVWLGFDTDGGTIPGWNAPVRFKKKRGRRRKYSQMAIETALRIGAVYHLRLRQAEGFLRSLFSLLNLTADVPDHSTVSRRSAKLGRVNLGASRSDEPVHSIIDSTGGIGGVARVFLIYATRHRFGQQIRSYSSTQRLFLDLSAYDGELPGCAILWMSPNAPSDPTEMTKPCPICARGCDR